MTTEFDRQRDIEAEGQRAAAYYARKEREADLPQHLPELIVCRNAAHADFVRSQIGKQPNIHVISAGAGVSQFRGRTFAKITICEGVNLQRDVDGNGSLESILRDRQRTWGDRAVFVVL